MVFALPTLEQLVDAVSRAPGSTKGTYSSYIADELRRDGFVGLSAPQVKRLLEKAFSKGLLTRSVLPFGNYGYRWQRRHAGRLT
ncbi:hypothetical protein MASR1M32_10360 [Rhodobacter sp.]